MLRTIKVWLNISNRRLNLKSKTNKIGFGKESKGKRDKNEIKKVYSHFLVLYMLFIVKLCNKLIHNLVWDNYFF